MSDRASTVAERRRPGSAEPRPAPVSGPATAPVAPSPRASLLLDEAASAATAGQWGRSTRILAAAAAAADDPGQRREILRRLAVTAADGRRHRASAKAVLELQQQAPTDPDNLVAFANVALARGNFVHADRAARSALDQDSTNGAAWVALAAGYCGLGWFEAAEACLNRVPADDLTDVDRWRIGRAVNRWAMTNSRWLIAGALSAVLVGVLAIAIATSIPFVTRQWRLTSLRSVDDARRFDGERFEKLATDAWRTERHLRLGHAVAVCVSVLGFAAAVAFL